MCSFKQIKKDTLYTAGIHANIKEGTNIVLAAYDGNPLKEDTFDEGSLRRLTYLSD